MKVTSMYFIVNDIDKYEDIKKVIKDNFKCDIKGYMVLLENDVTIPFLIINLLKENGLSIYIEDIMIFNGCNSNSSVKELLES